MKTIERIILQEENLSKLTIGYLDTETEIPDIENLDFLITDLSTENQTLINDCKDILQSTLEEGRVINRGFMQITKAQHECEERILLFTTFNEEDTTIFYPVRLMTEIDKAKYDEFKDMCLNLLLA